MKIKAANSFEFVDINRDAIVEYIEKHKSRGRFEEANELTKIVQKIDEDSNADIETIVNESFDKNLREIKALRKEIRKLSKEDDYRKDIRNKIKDLMKRNRALVPFSMRQRLRIVAATNPAIH